MKLQLAFLAVLLGTTSYGQGYFRPPVPVFSWINNIPQFNGSDGLGRPFTADVNADGLPDIIHSGVPVRCGLGLPGGGFGPLIGPTSWILADLYRLIDATADVDGDGNLDLFGSGIAAGFQLLLGDGAGGFTPGPAAAGAIDRLMRVGDLDNDGIPELIGGSTASYGALAVWKYVGGSWIETQQVYSSSSSSVRDLTLGDFNGDGWLDIAMLEVLVQVPPLPVIRNTRIYVNDGTGNAFVDHGNLTGTGDVGLMASDLDGDGCDDLVAHTAYVPGAAGVPTYRGDPALILRPATYSPVGAGLALSLVDAHYLRDMNGDGFDDLVTLASTAGPSTSSGCLELVRIMLGDGSGGFRPVEVEDEPMPTCYSTTGIGDVDGDGDRDLIFVRAPVAITPSSADWSLGVNEAITGPGTIGAAGVAPRLVMPTLPYPGNLAFDLRLTRAAPTQPAFLALGLAPAAAGTTPANWWLDLNQLVLPSPTIGVTTTNALGEASVPIPIPALPGLAGAEVYVQWAVRDPAGAFALSPTQLFAFSEARKIVVR